MSGRLLFFSGRNIRYNYSQPPVRRRACQAKLMKHPCCRWLDASLLLHDLRGRCTIFFQNPLRQLEDPRKAGRSVCRSEKPLIMISLTFIWGNVGTTHFRTSLSEGSADAISCRILSIWSFDIKGYEAEDTCSPSIGIISLRITSCSPSAEGWAAVVSSLRKAAILFCPRYLDSLGSSSSWS
jgi:hypothetical protein